MNEETQVHQLDTLPQAETTQHLQIEATIEQIQELSIVGDNVIRVTDETTEFSLNQLYRVNPLETDFRLQKLPANRDVRYNRLLRQSVDNDGIIAPIIVNSQFRIIDGQHRYQLAHQLGIDYDFIIRELPDEDQDMVIRMNNASHRWNFLDQITHYAKRGNRDYQVLQVYLDRFSDHMSQTMISKVAAGAWPLTQREAKGVQEGNFKLYSVEAMTNFYDALVDLSNRYNVYLKRDFTIAFYALWSYKDFDMTRFLDKIQQNPDNSVSMDKWANDNDKYRIFSEMVALYNRSLSATSPMRLSVSYQEHPQSKIPIAVPIKFEIDPEKADPEAENSHRDTEEEIDEETDE